MTTGKDDWQVIIDSSVLYCRCMMAVMLHVCDRFTNIQASTD